GGGLRCRPPGRDGPGNRGRGQGGRLHGPGGAGRGAWRLRLGGGEREVRPDGEGADPRRRQEARGAAGGGRPRGLYDAHRGRDPLQRGPLRLRQHHRGRGPGLRPHERLLRPRHGLHDDPLREVAQGQGPRPDGLQEPLDPAGGGRYGNHRHENALLVRLRRAPQERDAGDHRGDRLYNERGRREAPLRRHGRPAAADSGGAEDRDRGPPGHPL
ncbi:MAG: N-acetylmuramoyl-L-alanine amidase, partial [uncultured Rubrobacteraceae bacterium]